jgi:hypothetical protein
MLFCEVVRRPTAGQTVLIGIAVLSLLTGGCGGDSFHHVSGNATFKSEPIPTGKIYFQPDASKGNTGATGYAEIVAGKYDTKATGGQGTIGGPMIVRIEGADGVAIDEDRPSGKPLFTFYETQVEMPAEDSTKDFDVPASATKGKSPTSASVVVP